MLRHLLSSPQQMPCSSSPRSGTASDQQPAAEVHGDPTKLRSSPFALRPLTPTRPGPRRRRARGAARAGKPGPADETPGQPLLPHRAAAHLDETSGAAVAPTMASHSSSPSEMPAASVPHQPQDLAPERTHEFSPPPLSSAARATADPRRRGRAVGPAERCCRPSPRRCRGSCSDQRAGPVRVHTRPRPPAPRHPGGAGGTDRPPSPVGEAGRGDDRTRRSPRDAGPPLHRGGPGRCRRQGAPLQHGRRRAGAEPDGVRAGRRADPPRPRRHPGRPVDPAEPHGRGVRVPGPDGHADPVGRLRGAPGGVPRSGRLGAEGGLGGGPGGRRHRSAELGPARRHRARDRGARHRGARPLRHRPERSGRAAARDVGHVPQHLRELRRSHRARQREGARRGPGVGLPRRRPRRHHRPVLVDLPQPKAPERMALSDEQSASRGADGAAPCDTHAPDRPRHDGPHPPCHRPPRDGRTRRLRGRCAGHRPDPRRDRGGPGQEHPVARPHPADGRSLRRGRTARLRDARGGARDELRDLVRGPALPGHVRAGPVGRDRAPPRQ